MILIGSRAIKHHFPDFTREPKDWDYVVSDIKDEHLDNMYRDEGSVKTRVEFHVIPQIMSRYDGFSVLSPNHLYTLKMSHIFWPIKQEKHLYDIKFLKDKGCRIDWPFFEDMFEYWTDVHGPNTRLDFKKDNDKFFEDKVDRKHPHDDLHVMMNPNPSYLLAKENVEMADISQEIFITLPKKVQMDICKEEAYVLALERILIPGHKVHWRVAYTKMLRAMISRLTPRWLGIFMTENYHELTRPEFDYYKKYKAIQHGEVNV